MIDHTAPDNSGERPIELASLDPDVDPHAAERFVSDVMARVVRAAVPIRVPVDPLYGLWALSRPLLLAASIAGVVTIGAWQLFGSRDGPPPGTVAEATGVPPEFLRLADGSR